MTVNRSTIVAVSLALSLGIQSPAFAQNANAAAAEALFREGKKLYESKSYSEACEKLQESQRLDPASGTLLALALCHEADGKLATAWAEYADVSALLKREGRSDKELAARERVAVLEAKLSTLTVVVPDATGWAGLEVKRDGVPIGRASWGSAVPVDPGEHVVEAAAPGKKPWKTVVVIGANADKQTLAVPQLAPAPSAAPAPAASEAIAVTSPTTTPSNGRRTAGLVVGGIGVVGVAIGTVFAIKMSSSNHDATQICADNPNACPGEQIVQHGSLLDDAKTDRAAAAIGFAAGTVGVVSGIVLVLTAGPSSGSSTGVGVRPMIMRNGGALVVGAPW